MHCRFWKLLSTSNKHFSSSRYQTFRHVTYDYIVIGCGSAGCVLANRLSENQQDNVLAIEAGPQDPWWDLRIHMPAAMPYNLHSHTHNWAYHTTPQKHLNNRTISWPRGKVWGGSSAINAMLYIRGHQKDFDRWEFEGAEGWSFDDCLPYFKKSETHPFEGSEYRGDKGPMKISKPSLNDEIFSVFIDAAIEYGLPYNDDFNGADQIGVGPHDLNIHKGKRWSTSQAYLRPAMNRPNLSVESRAICTRVLFEGSKAVGVEVLQGNDIKQFKASKEVILAGGAINSPQLLMLSGIGDESELKKHDISVNSHLPGVGKNLQDHMTMYVRNHCKQPVTIYKNRDLWRGPFLATQWMLFNDGPYASNGMEAAAFFNTNNKVTHPDGEVLFIGVASPDLGLTFPYGESFSLLVGTLRASSRGKITLESKDPRDYPLIDPNYLGTEEDVIDMRNSLKVAREIVQQPAFDNYRGDEILPGLSVQTDDEIDACMRENAGTNYHASCTCKMGDVNDPFTVVDPRTRVKGFENLRVVDASIMPSITSGNLNAAVIMMAEKAADIIKEDNKSR